MEKKIHSANNDCHLGTTRRKATPSSCQTPLQKPPCFLKSFTFCYGPKLSETVCATGVLSIIPGSSWRPAFNKERQCLMKSALQLKYTQKKKSTQGTCLLKKWVGLLRGVWVGTFTYQYCETVQEKKINQENQADGDRWFLCGQISCETTGN